jgi:hypothetical protein
VAHRVTFPLPAHCLVEFSPDGRWLVLGTAREFAGFEIGETGAWRRAWVIPQATAGDLPGLAAFSPDGRLLTTGTDSPSVVKLYRAGTAEEVATLPSPAPYPVGVRRFSPDGTRLLTFNLTDRMCVWDLRVIRARLVRLGLDWDQPPLPPAEVDPPAARVDVDLGELHPARLQAAESRRVLRDKPNDPRSSNNLAWCLVTGPDDLRDPGAALPLAETAVRLDPRHEHLNTLGVVYYRLDRWRDAVGALNRSIEAKKDATAFDTFFLAMCYHRLDEPGKARAEYARAVRWMELFRPDDEGLIRFRAEAEALIGR